MAYEQKTKPTEVRVAQFIESLPTEKRQKEAAILVPLFEEVTGEPATMWGPSIIGFGNYDYTYQSGHSGTAARTGFSPRKAALTFYLYFYEGALDHILPRLGKHRVSKGCLYVNKLEDIDLDVLKEAIAESVKIMDEHYPRAK